MKLKRFTYLILIASMLACSFVTSQLFSPTPAPESGATTALTAAPISITIESTSTPAIATPTALAPAYIPATCQNVPPATISAATALAQPTPLINGNPQISKELQQRVFAQTVEVIEKVYVYPDYNGKDWPAIVSKYQAKIDAGLGTEDFYTAMREMIVELGDDHSSFQSPVDVAQADAELAGNNEFVGVGVFIITQMDKEQVALISVFPNSPADHGGLKSHDAILAVDGKRIVENGNLYINLARGPECSATVLKVKSPGQEPRDVMLVRERIQGPALIDARLVTTTDGSRVGYIFIPTFYDQTIPRQIEDALNNFGPLDGLILDNRMNGGGSSDVLEPVLSYFAAGTLGHFVSRKESRPLTITPHPIQNSQSVPLVVLVGHETASFGEIFAGVLQDSGRAEVVGQTTFGNVEVLQGYNFDDGSRMWIAQETFDPAVSHVHWEGRGIIPDVEAFADWDTFTFENDPSVAAALKLLGHK